MSVFLLLTLQRDTYPFDVEIIATVKPRYYELNETDKKFHYNEDSVNFMAYEDSTMHFHVLLRSKCNLCLILYRMFDFRLDMGSFG